MNLFVIDTFCVILAVAGIVIALRGARAPHQRPDGSRFHGEPPAPATYATRIVGVMMAAFGLALGVLATGFSLATG